MDVFVEFHEASLQHNISKEDIIHALKHRTHDALVVGDIYGKINR